MKSIVNIAAVCLLLAGSVFGQAKIQEGGTLFESGQVQFQPPAGTSPPAFTITTLSLPADTEGVAYPATTVQTANGTAPVTCSTTSTLPTGLSLAANCTFSGTPTTVGNYPVVVVANDNASHTAQKTFNIAISCPTLQILSPPTLPVGDVGFVYNFTVQIAGGIGPFTFTMPGLPTGETINSTTGAISGTPSVPGSFTPVLTLTDSCPTQSQIVTQNFIEQVNSGLSITTATLPNGQVGQAFSAQLNVAGGTPPYQWTVPSGPIPAGADDILDWMTLKLPDRLSFHLTGGATPKYVKIDAGVLWETKSAAGNPSDIRTYDKDFTYQVYTDNNDADQQAACTAAIDPNTGLHYSSCFVDPFAYKQIVTPRKFTPRYFVPGSTVTIMVPPVLTGGGQVNPYIKTTNCGLDNQPIAFLGNVKTVTSGGLAMPSGIATWGGDVGVQPTLEVDYFYSGNVSGVYVNRERFYFVKGWGWVSWDHATWNGSAYNPPDQGSTNNLKVAGGAPTPNFACKIPNLNTLALAGTLPPGVTSTSSPQMNMPSNTGAESGTPNTDGTYTFTVQVEDSTGKFAQHTYTQTIGCAPLAISTQTLPNGTQNQAFSFQEVATGGFGNLTWSGNQFPSGIGISLTGSISGSTANFGTFHPQVVVTDSCPTPQSVSIQPTLTIAQQIGTLAIQTPTTFPQAVEGQPFQLQMSASGGLTPYSWALIGGAFPPGFASMTATGSISGTPTQSGAFSPVIQVTDAQPVSISNTFHLTVVCPPFSVPIANPMPTAQQGVLYSGYQVPTSGGIAPFTFSASGLPTGLGINTSTGAITGTPSVNGPFSPSVTVTDSCQPVGTPVTANTTLQVNTPTLAIVTASLAPGQINQPYSQPLSGQGGTPPYAWSITAGTLQTGLSLSGASIQGTPSVASTVNLTIQLADSAAHTVTGNFNLTINAAQTGDNADCSTTNQWIGPASDGPAGAPQLCFNTARANSPSNGATVNVTSGSCASLQAAVNAAVAGQTIITPVATYANCQITPKTAGTASAWITLKTAAFASLPPEGTNVTPAWAGVTALTGRPAYAQPAVAGTYLPKISSNTAGSPTINFQSTAAFWRVEGFNIVSAPSVDGFSIVQAQTGANHIILDQVWINGADANQSKNSVQGGFRINGSAQSIALVDSTVTNIGCINGGTCGDAQGVFLGGSAAGIDGPLKVVNNFIEAAGENIFSGGGGVGTTTLPATDVEIRHNHFFKPLYLKSNDPTYIGVNFNIKNCMEFKNAQRVWAEGNVFEGDWAGQSDQHGVCILLDSRNQNFSYTGTASASGNTLTWVSGSQFQSNIVSPSCAPGGCRVTFNGTACVGTGFISATQITVSCGSGSSSIANNWQQVPLPSGAAHIRDFAINPTNNHWYIIDRVSGAWVSTNQGTSWTQINNGISPITGWTITYDVTDSQIVAGFINGASSAKFFRSSNDGATWTAMPYTGSTVNFPAYTGTARSPVALIFGGGNSGSAGTCATFFSTNAGASSTVASCPANQTAPPSGGAYSYLYNPIDGALWMGGEQNGGYCSTNNGASWIPGTPPDQNFGGPLLGNLQGLTYDNAGVMVFSAQGGIYKANSAGCSLHTLTNVKPTGGAPNGRNLGRDTNGNLYWGHSGVTTDLHAVYQSTDGGVTWHVFDTGLPTNATGGKSFEAWQFHQNPADCQMYVNLQDGTGNAATLWRTVGTCTGGLPPQVANAAFTAATPGLNPSAVLTDVVLKNNVIKHAANGLQIANPPSDNGDLSLTNARIAVDNNSFDDINGKTYVTNGDCCNYGAVFQIQNQEAGAAQLDQIYVVHNTGLSIFPSTGSGAGAMGFGTAITGTSIGHMTFLNNLGTAGWFSGSVNTCGTGTTAEAYLVCWTPPAQLCWSNNLLAIATFTAGGNTANNPPYPTGADNGNCPVAASKTNTTIASFAAFNFTTLNNANGGNYQLQGSSPGHNAASDGTDIGVIWPQLQNAIAGVP